MSSFPLKIYWKTVVDPGQKYPAKVAIAVPRKKFRKAVDRNLLKRRIRESYRRNKHPLYEFLNKSDFKLRMVILFLSNEFMPYEQIDEIMRSMLSKLVQKIGKCD